MVLKKYLPILSGLLVFQAALFAGLYTLQTKKTQRSASETALLSEMNFDQMSSLKITDNTDQKNVELKKIDGKWIMPAYFDFPVSPSKIQDVIHQLSSIKVSWPVGQTMIAAKQFHTVPEQFEKKLEFFEADKSALTIYFGSSPTFKKLHIRVHGSENTYSVDFNSYDVPSTSIAWADKKIYEVPRTEIANLKIGNLELISSDAGFNLPSIPEGFEMDTVKVDSAIGVITHPDFEEVLGKKDALKTGAKEEFSYTVTNKKQEQIVYTYYAHENIEAKDEEKKEAEFYDLKISSQPFVFKVRNTRVLPLLQATESSLIKKKEQAASPAKKEETKAEPSEVQG